MGEPEGVLRWPCRKPRRADPAEPLWDQVGFAISQLFGKGNSCGLTQDCQAPLSSRWREALGFHRRWEQPVGNLAARRA